MPRNLWYVAPDGSRYPITVPDTMMDDDLIMQWAAHGVDPQHNPAPTPPQPPLTPLSPESYTPFSDPGGRGFVQGSVFGYPEAAGRMIEKAGDVVSRTFGRSEDVNQLPLPAGVRDWLRNYKQQAESTPGGRQAEVAGSTATAMLPFGSFARAAGLAPKLADIVEGGEGLGFFNRGIGFEREGQETLNVPHFLQTRIGQPSRPLEDLANETSAATQIGTKTQRQQAIHREGVKAVENEFARGDRKTSFSSIPSGYGAVEKEMAASRAEQPFMGQKRAASGLRDFARRHPFAATAAKGAGVGALQPTDSRHDYWPQVVADAAAGAVVPFAFRGAAAGAEKATRIFPWWLRAAGHAGGAGMAYGLGHAPGYIGAATALEALGTQAAQKTLRHPSVGRGLAAAGAQGGMRDIAYPWAAGSGEQQPPGNPLANPRMGPQTPQENPVIVGPKEELGP